MSTATDHDGARRQHRRGGVPIFASDGALLRRVSREQAAEVVKHGGEWSGDAVYLAGITGAPMKPQLNGLRLQWEARTEMNHQGTYAHRSGVLPA